MLAHRHVSSPQSTAKPWWWYTCDYGFIEAVISGSRAAKNRFMPSTQPRARSPERRHIIHMIFIRELRVTPRWYCCFIPFRLAFSPYDLPNDPYDPCEIGVPFCEFFLHRSSRFRRCFV